MIKLLIGGSPCTFWSIAQKNGRETEAKGMGWELFKNYLVAKEKFKPDFFLYENNKSAAKAIKDQIKEELKVWDGTLCMEDTGARYIEINSALVSAQKRQRFYVHNCGEVEQPEDRGILLRDILESSPSFAFQVGYRNRRETDGKLYRRFETSGHEKSNALTTVTTDSMVAEPIRVGALPRPNGELSTSQAFRVYSVDGKSVTINAGGGGAGGKTGLYAVPIDGKTKGENPIYEVKDGLITIKGKQNILLNLQTAFISCVNLP
jgi:DNA (cytosine-5)-methyltransferase 3A